MTILDELRGLDTSKGALRNFGLVVGGVFLGIVAFVFWRRGFETTTVLNAVALGAGVLVSLALVAPRVLKPAHRVWMLLALILGFVMTRVILTVMYYLVFTPIGLVLRALGRDPMARSLGGDSYWIERTVVDDSPARLTKYY
jgi:hypothetical protein